ncbi:ribonuclease III [Thalassoroseus pseudoceratinae]|uniref:ribonuclease III n=1 Tax=Thalassoroseus pseudoceratinae TaxID=2713176 RepID=UPI0014216039|nr:ribonuclease III [Thalassoroseus pseudoceratinae]
MSNAPRIETIADRLELCQQQIGYQFRDLALLQRCLTHASAANSREECNERLEFLGDAILGAVVCDLLFQMFPDATEGELTRIKSAVVSRHTCAIVCGELKLESCLILGKGLSGGQRVPSSIRAAVIESLVAGVYLDGGYPDAVAFVSRIMNRQIEQTGQRSRTRNFKSQLQQLAQKDLGETPVYRLLDEKGPDHSKCFEVSAIIGQQVFPPAWGPTKKEAEQQAACNALHDIQKTTEEAESDDF